ncbi:MAG: bifunctional proline dehydrogenase/L-glutamate gamma-semialdehyde dehydrogenase PutA, partial [Cocleimonas sp.]
MNYLTPFYSEDELRVRIQENYLLDEEQAVGDLLNHFSNQNSQFNVNIKKTATELVETIRNADQKLAGIDSFLKEYKLSSEEGISLMCLAEALLRIPDADSSDRLIKDKLKDKDWASHIGKSDSLFVNASSWGLLLTGKFVGLGKDISDNPKDYISRLVTKTGEPVLRKAMMTAMQVMGKQFVLAESIEGGVKESQSKNLRKYLYSYDMLGEAARTAKDAENYYASYLNAIHVIGKSSKQKNPYESAGISIKLSALHPRYEFNQEQRVMNELLPLIVSLCEVAVQYDIGVTIDAEESERLEPSLTILEALFKEPKLKDWNGLGFVVQAYQKRAPAVLDWIESLSIKHNRRVMIRLVKGAYWDSEVKKAQTEGVSDYPVYTQKFTTDVAYLLCVDKLLSNQQAFYPLFATHNAHSVAYILNTATKEQEYEFQCLHGMGEVLYDQIVKKYKRPVRIYAPVGEHKDLLAYLVRRLLENGANNSFVNRLVDKTLSVESLIENPIEKLATVESKRHPNIPKPSDMFIDRKNSNGLNLADVKEIESLHSYLRANEDATWQIGSNEGNSKDIKNPATSAVIGTYESVDAEFVNQAMLKAQKAFSQWDRKGGEARAVILEKAADLYEENSSELIQICMLEAGKTILDADSEVREAVDFLRYYAKQAIEHFEGTKILPGPTGEKNEHFMAGRGVFACISPWNFPLAIFTGQLSAALAAGNCVLAKPAEQTPIIATRAVELLNEAGVPKDVLQLMLGGGAEVGGALTSHPKISGVTFTGSTATAKRILQNIVSTDGPIIPFIAETGGLNAMIADSSTLIEQLVDDCISSAFQSAGQRCSALRVLYVQKEIYSKVLTDLQGAMAELIVGSTAKIETDIGPIIDQQALDNLNKHIKEQQALGRSVYRGQDIAKADQSSGFYFSPAIIEIDSINDLAEEVFGPILHIVPYASDTLDQVIEDINDTGYGLTFGIHSRINSKVEYISKRIHAGNIYINRNTIGAVVGVQPFGGEGLSGTGPKAGGPHYVTRFGTERV